MPGEDGKIYITISKGQNGALGGGSVAGVSTPAPTTGGETGSSDSFSLATYAGTMLLNTLKQQAVKVTNYGISNIGKFTGDYQKQREVQQVVQMGEMALGVGQTFIAGTIASGGNPIVGLVAAGVDVAAIGVNVILDEISTNFEIRQRNREIQIMRMLSGLDSLSNGGRGTRD